MTTFTRKLRRAAALITLASSAALVTVAAQADEYPGKAVRIIVPVATGGTSDVLARVIGARLQSLWGQGVVVENKAGVAGNLGTEMVVRSPADGYTLVLQSNSMVVTRAVGTRSNFDYEKDLTPIALLGQTPMILVAHPSQGIASLADLVAKAKKDPQSLSYASCGIGTPHHMFMELLKQRTGIELNHVAYKGCSPGLTDVLGNQVPIGVFSANLAVPYVRDGKVIAIGVSSAERYSALPNVKTLDEQGAKPLDMTNWFALFGPAGLPKDVVARLDKDIKKVMAEESVKKALSDAGVDVTEGDGAQLAALVKSERARYEAVARSANIKLE